MKKQFKRKLKLKNKVLFNLIRLGIVLISIMLMIASFKEGNWRHNSGIFFLEIYLIMGVVMLEDFIK